MAYYASSYDKDHNNETVIHIGEYEERYSILEQLIGSTRVKKYGMVYVDIFPDEGSNVPHFHVHSNKDYRRKEEGDLDCCICLYDNKFFVHGHHSDTMTNKQLKQLEKFLKSNNNLKKSEFSGLNNWEVMSKIWQSSKEVPKSLNTSKMPDYTSTEKFVSE